jgi:hypothetical protein
MKNKVMFLTAICTLLSLSCTNKSEETKSELLTPVIVQVNGFTTSIEDFETRAGGSVESYTGVKAITLAFYDKTDGSQVYKHTQLREDATTYSTFGTFTTFLPQGSYTMVVVGSGLNSGEPAITLTSPTFATFGDYPARETFSSTQAVDITDNDPVELNPELNRIISRLVIESTDTRVAGAKDVRVSFSAGGKSFNPTTGLATVNTGFSNTVAISAKVGEISRTASYLFLATDEQTMNVTIDVLDADGAVLFSKTVSNVPFLRNRLTRLIGSLYSSSVTAAFTVNTAWLDEYDMNF